MRRLGSVGIAGGLALALAAVLCLVLVVGLPVVSMPASVDSGSEIGASEGVSALARREIPPEYLRLYIAAAQRYGLDWAVLAGIGRVECDHGRDPSPSCTEQGVENSAGAGGPMQFLASTWARYGVDPYGNAPPNRWNAGDAIFSAANYLRASGAPHDYRAAIYAYNHAWWYVEEVLSWARRYRGAPESGSAVLVDEEQRDVGRALGRWGRAFGPAASATPVLYVPGRQAKLLLGDGHVALIPEDVPASVQAMVIAGNELQDMPYGPTGHPDPLGASSEDCSSTVNYVLYKAGVRSLAEILAQNPLAQDYVDWGDPGPGRWVTIYATDLPQPHVFIVITGLRLDTSYQGTDEGPNRDEGGPRWRLLPFIPTWAHWSVRHPPGL